jgi:hypothetical protein
MVVCEKLGAAGVAASCKQDAANDVRDNVDFSIPSAATKKGTASGLVMCEPNGKAFETMTDGLREQLGDLEAKHKSVPGASPVFASAATRVIVTLFAEEPISSELQSKTKAVVDSLASSR